MSIFHRMRHLLRGRRARLRRLKQAVHYLMNHIKMTGDCDCLATRGADGRHGYALIIQTRQLIPAEYREWFQSYFRRKLVELGEVHSTPLMLVIHDGNDLMNSHHLPEHVSAARMASIIDKANDEETVSSQIAQRLAEMHKRMGQNRLHRQKADDRRYKPVVSAPMTNIGEYLPPVVSAPMTDIGTLEPALDGAGTGRDSSRADAAEH